MPEKIPSKSDDADPKKTPETVKPAHAVPLPTPLPDEGSAVTARKDDEDSVDFGQMPEGEGGSSNLSHSQISGPLSGTSVVSWNDLMKTRAEEESSIQYDSLEDIDLDSVTDSEELLRAVNEEPPSSQQVGGGKKDKDKPVSRDFIDLETDLARQKSKSKAKSRDKDSIHAIHPDLDQSSSILNEPSGQDESSHINLLRDQPKSIDVADTPSADSLAAEFLADSGIEAPSDHTGPTSPKFIKSNSNDKKLFEPVGDDSGAVDLLDVDSESGFDAVEDDSATASTIRVVESPSRFGSWVGGGIVGGLIGVAVCVGLWLSGAVPTPTKSTQAPAVSPKPAPVDAAAAMTLLETGNLDSAIAALDRPNATADEQAALGQARFLRYLRTAKQNGQTPAATADEVKLAQQNLSQAGTPTARLWLGLIEESLGRTKEASAIYSKALKELPDHSRLFQAALDRLETLPTGPPSNQQGRASFGAAVYTLLVYAAPDSKTPGEAGFDFWAALKLAKAHQYSQAMAALTQARSAHDARRFQLAQKGLNPTSDPFEEIFLRCCDELKACWQMREQLAASGVNLAQYPNPGSAFSSYVNTAKKNSDELKKLQTALASARDAISQAKLDPNDLAAAFNRLLKDKETSDTAARQAQNEIQSAVEALKTAQGQKVEAEDARKKLEIELKKVQAQLAASKPAAPVDTGESVRLKNELERMETKTKELESQLAAAARTAEGMQRSVRELSGFAGDVRQRLQAPPDAKSNEVLTALDSALAAKPMAELGPLPPGALTADPRAERAFHRGLNAIRVGNLSEAEREFRMAVTLQNRDARYWYALGLSQSGQGLSNKADESFRNGMDRERRNLPNPDAVDVFLERMSASDRQAINRVRGRG